MLFSISFIFFVFFRIKKVNCSCFIFYSVAAPLIEKDNILRVMQNACLVLHVYCEKLKKNSFWKPYLGILYTEQRKSCVCVLLHHSFTVVSIQSIIIYYLAINFNRAQKNVISDKMVALGPTCKHVQKCTITAINTPLNIFFSLHLQIILRP